jgi:hypothetical protein
MVYTEKIAVVLRSVKIAEVYSVCRMKKFLMLHLMVRKVSTGSLGLNIGQNRVQWRRLLKIVMKILFP